MDQSQLFDRARRCAEWMLKNQITERLDANRGRCIRCCDLATGHVTLTGNWQTGVLTMCLCALHKRTGDAEFLRRAEFAGRYIMSLQVMDQSDRRYFGTLREITPQSIEVAPRDATTAAWGLVWLYNATKNPLYLQRAVLFGEWHMKHGMYAGWPLYSVYMDPAIPDHYMQGGFQSGTGLFYHDLFMASGDARFIENGFKPIAVNYRGHFFRAFCSSSLQTFHTGCGTSQVDARDRLTQPGSVSCLQTHRCRDQRVRGHSRSFSPRRMADQAQSRSIG